MRSLILSLLTVFTFLHLNAQGLKSDIGINDGIDYETFTFPIVFGSYTYLCFQETTDINRNYIQKNNISGEKLWKKSLQEMLSEEFSNHNLGLVNVFDFRTDSYGNLYIHGWANEGCDMMGYNINFTIKLTNNGDKLWLKYWPLGNDNQYFSNIPFIENEVWIAKNTATIDEPDKIDLIKLNVTTGEQIDSLPDILIPAPGVLTYSNEYPIIATSGSKIYGISEDGDVLQTIDLADQIRGLVSNNGLMYVLFEDEIKIFDGDLNLVNTVTFGNQYDLTHLKYIDNHLNVLNWGVNGFSRIILDANLAIVNEINFAPFEGYNSQSYGFVDYNNEVLNISHHHPIQLFEAIRSITYSMTSSEDETIERVDAAIIDIDFYDVSISQSDNAPEHVMKQQAFAKILIENLGNFPISSLNAYVYVGQWFCGPAAYFYQLTNLNILPGEQQWIDVGQVHYDVNFLYPEDGVYKRTICVNISNPNGIIDLNIDNDSYCGEAILGTVGLTNNTLLNLDKKPIKITDILGREIEKKTNTLMLYIYEDGTSEKVIIKE
ncbi:MAG: hypothetical protein H3C31_03500 [Brumimicrobium sp.]|nr:hypothetical protein [Brumimicrobium sp.]